MTNTTQSKEYNITKCRTEVMHCGFEFWDVNTSHLIKNGDVIFWFNRKRRDGSDYIIGLCGWCKDRILKDEIRV